MSKLSHAGRRQRISHVALDLSAVQYHEGNLRRRCPHGHGGRTGSGFHADNDNEASRSQFQVSAFGLLVGSLHVIQIAPHGICMDLSGSADETVVVRKTVEQVEQSEYSLDTEDHGHYRQVNTTNPGTCTRGILSLFVQDSIRLTAFRYVYTTRTVYVFEKMFIRAPTQSDSCTKIE